MIVSSPLSRALQTVQPLADLVGLEISTDARLIDRDYGEWAGVSTQAVIERWGSLDAAPGVEPVTAVRDRVLAALADIAARALGAAAVVVSHDVVIRTALAALDPGLGDPTSVPQETGCFNTLEYQRTASTVVRWAVLNVNQVPSPAW
jgi:broad specificity phosphatase PhoE